MATAYWLKRDEEIAVQEEATYGTSPGALAGTDFFKATSGHEGFVSKLEELPRPGPRQVPGERAGDPDRPQAHRDQRLV